MQIGSLENIGPSASAMKDEGLWVERGRPYWTAVFPPGATPDPEIVKAIRVFCPEFAPLWVVRSFVAPTGGERSFGYYAFAVHLEHPDESEADAWEGLGPVSIETPPDWPFKSGRMYVFEVLAHEWKPDSWQFRCNVPPPGEVFDARALTWMQATDHRRKNTNIVQDKLREIRAAKAAEMAALDKGRQERKLANREDRFQLLRWLGGKATSSTAVPPTPKPKKARPS